MIEIDSYRDLVAEGLKLDFTLLHVHWVPGEVHLAADVEVDALAEPHDAVVVNLHRLWRVVKLWRPA